MTKRWGATPEDWARFKKLAKVDLLPVVSNPHAVISPKSKMKGLGKTPSIYNSQDQASGFTDWTDHETTVRNIEAWAEEGDYGICVQTRRIRGFDIDVPDAALADEIGARFLELLGIDALPTRSRADSGKKLMAFVCEAELSKRSFVVKEWVDDETGKTKRWIVELLATGQQFVAVGTHPDGERYDWADGLPDVFPAVDLQRLDDAWDTLVAEYALAGVDRRAERRDPTLLEDLDVDDPVAEHLVEHWTTYGYEKGMLYIECPWSDGHSSDNGETQTAWLLAGTGKYRNGHFRCMHAGCAEHSDDAFFKVVAYKALGAEEFDDLSADEDAVALYVAAAPGASAKSKEIKAEARALSDGAKLPLPGFNRDNSGRIETSLENIARALRAVQACGVQLQFDEFRGELMIAEREGQWRPFVDADGVRLRITLEALGFKDKIGRELMRDALTMLGDEQRFDSAQHWLLEVVPEWDGVPRVGRFWPHYLNTKDTPYTQALGLYSWTAQAARILDPGCQVDMVPVMVSPEGYAKTSVIAALAPSRDFFAEFNLGHDDEKLARLMRGCLVGELAELRGVAARDGEAVKAWITRRHEKWTPKYQEYATTLARRMVFYGTTNDPEFLQAHMGERRWLPVDVLSKIDVGLIERDREQLWAEARDIWLADGIQWSAVERLAGIEREGFKHTDPWMTRVALWLDDPIDTDSDETPRASGTLRAEEVLTQCLGMDASKIKKADQQRIGEVLKNLGLERIQLRVDGRNRKVWIDTGEGDVA